MTKSGSFISPNGEHELGFVWDGKEFYAGYISNSGCNKQWKIEYNEDFSFDENLQLLYEYIDDNYD